MISVITINLNNKKGLEASIQSVIDQNASNFIEFIIVDGCSEDGSQELIQRNKEFINKIIIEKDSGIFEAMNKGIELASQDYIYFLNSGDIFATNDTILKVLPYLEDCHDIVCGRVNAFVNNRFQKEINVKPWLAHQGAFVSSRIMKSYKFDSNYKIFGDLDLWYRLVDDKIFNPVFCDVIVCNMEMDGVGSHPKFYKTRIKDKKRIFSKHGGWKAYVPTVCIEYVKFTYYTMFGEASYWNKFIPMFERFRSIVRGV